MVGSTSVSSITNIAANARNLYRRAKISGTEFADVAPVVRSLHSVIKHLRAEAEDPDSLLNSSQQESSIYARQLNPIVEDTEFTLKQLDTILEKYGSYPSDHNSEDGDGTRRHRANSSVKKMEHRERDMVQLIRTKLANQKTNIDIFLDTVQLHNPTRQHQPVDLEHADDTQMNNIKDKVDAVAARIFQRRARARLSRDAPDDSQEDMWQEFWVELVKEGFAGDVLRKHKVSFPEREVKENCIHAPPDACLEAMLAEFPVRRGCGLTSQLFSTGSTSCVHPGIGVEWYRRRQSTLCAWPLRSCQRISCICNPSISTLFPSLARVRVSPAATIRVFTPAAAGGDRFDLVPSKFVPWRQHTVSQRSGVTRYGQ